jgi:hypothetical protein
MRICSVPKVRQTAVILTSTRRDSAGPVVSPNVSCCGIAPPRQPVRLKWMSLRQAGRRCDRWIATETLTLRCFHRAEASGNSPLSPAKPGRGRAGGLDLALAAGSDLLALNGRQEFLCPFPGVATVFFNDRFEDGDRILGCRSVPADDGD